MNEAANTADHQAVMHSIIQRIATGPHLSKDISFAEARAGMQAVLEGAISPVRAGIFLIALRMKRETDEENAGVLQALLDAAGHATADVDEVLDISDPYDGWNRGLPVAAFLPAVMAAAGVATVSHGVASVGPKFGATHAMVLRAAGRRVDLSPAQAAAQLSDANIGWAYVDQSAYCPALYQMADFRKELVKRTVITTVEVLIGPVRGRKATHVMTGYVHKPYPPLYASLARHAGFASAVLTRGVEGGVIPSLQQKAKMFYYHDMGEEQEMDLDPAELGIRQNTRCPPLPDNINKTKGGAAPDPDDIKTIARLAAAAGLAALGGERGAAYDSLVYAGAIAARHLRGDETLATAAALIRAVLDSGEARARFQAAASL